MASEVMGLLYGKYGGSSHVLEAGGLSYEASFMPHGGKTQKQLGHSMSKMCKQRRTKHLSKLRMRSSHP